MTPTALAPTHEVMMAIHKNTTRAAFGILLSASLGTFGCGDKHEAKKPEQIKPAATVVAANVDCEDAKNRVRLASKELGETLRGKLMAAMKESPSKAVEICAKEALPLTEEIATKHGVSLGRTSSKLRNRKNAAAPQWVGSWLKSHENPPWETSLAVKDKKARFIAPLPTAAACAGCHGKDIKPKIAASIQEHYPKDRATGFAVGDLRGVIWAEANCSDADATKTKTQEETTTKMIDIKAIANGREVSEGVYASGQPTLEQIKELHASGLKTLVSARSAGEMLVAEEEALLKELGLTYVHIPMDGAAGVTMDNAKKLDETLASAAKPMLIHCGSSNRVGALFSLRANQIQGKTAEESIEIGKKAGMTSLEPHVRTLMK